MDHGVLEDDAVIDCGFSHYVVSKNNHGKVI